MGTPITTTAGGICFAFPDVCRTPVIPPPPPDIPIPYANTGQLQSAQGAATDVRAGGSPVVIRTSQIPTTTGDQAGTVGGVRSGTVGGSVTFRTFSNTVRADRQGIVRMFDTTSQNNGVAVGNAVGTVLGGFPTVRVGD